MTELPIGAAGDTNVGMAREKNEDNLFVTRPNDNVQMPQIVQKGFLYVVADGVGGGRGGARASEMAVTGIPLAYYASDGGDIEQNLSQAIVATSRQIINEGNANPATASMACTVAAAVVRGNEATIAHLGDARAYLWHEGQMFRLTRDHTWVQDQVDKGTLTDSEADSHPDRNVITKSMGAASLPTPSIRRVTLQSGDRLLLCSDGLCGVVGDAEMQAILASTADLGATVAALIARANKNGGPDNITALVVQAGQPVIMAVPLKGRKSLLPVLGVVGLLAAGLLGAWMVLRPPDEGPSTPASPQMVAVAGNTTSSDTIGSSGPAAVVSATSTVGSALADAVIPGDGTPIDGSVASRPVETVPVVPIAPGVNPGPSSVFDGLQPACSGGTAQATYDGNGTVPFSWRWNGQLQNNGDYLEIRVNGRSIGIVPTSAQGQQGWNFAVPVNTFREDGLSEYNWEVVQMAADHNTKVAGSGSGCFVVSGGGGGPSQVPVATDVPTVAPSVIPSQEAPTKTPPPLVPEPSITAPTPPPQPTP